jgi:hypothetical protein
VDHELGRILRRLRRTGLLRRSLLVVTADHGYSFDVGVLSRRKVSETNVEEIAPVPYFVKAPGQMKGAVDESLARTVDIVPTIADLLGVRATWRHNGRSAFSATTRRRTVVSLPTRGFDRVIRIGRDELQRRRRRIRVARAKLFGTGIESELLFGDPWASVYRIGPHRELLDRRLASLRVSSRGGAARASMANAGLVRHVDPGDELLPTRVEGTLGPGEPGALRDLAVAVNGRIRAVGRSFRLRFKRDEFFSFVVPEDSLRPGPNVVEVLEVRPGGTLVPLGRVG